MTVDEKAREAAINAVANRWGGDIGEYATAIVDDVLAAYEAAKPAPAGVAGNRSDWMAESIRAVLECDKRPVLLTEDQWAAFKAQARKWLAVAPEASIPAPAQGEAVAALRWAMDEIDILSNKLCQFAYPQGMAMVGREDQVGQYDAAIRARRAAPQSSTGEEGR